MKQIYILVLLAFASLTVGAQIPVETLFKRSEVTGMRISPDGKHVAATYEKDQYKKLAIIDINNMKIKHFIAIDQADREIGQFGWLNNSRIYYNINRVIGPLDTPVFTGYVYAQNIDGTRRRQLLPARGRMGKDDDIPSFYSILSLLPKEKKHILISMADGAYTSAYKLNIYSGHQSRVIKSPGKRAQLLTDQNGHVRAAQAFSQDGKSRQLFLRPTTKSDWQLFKTFSQDEKGINMLDFTPSGNGIYVEMEGKQGRGVYTLSLKDKSLKLVRKLTGDADIVGEVYEVKKGKPYLVGVSQQPGYFETVFFDDSTMMAKIYRSLGQAKAFAGEGLALVNSTRDGSKAIFRVWSGSNPGDFYLFDFEKTKLRPLLTVLPWIKRDQMADMKPISFKARDGMEIRGYLTLPKGKEKKKKLPMVLVVHGGPYGVTDDWRYNPEVQFFASRGYAVLQVNYRGSGGRGPKFTNDAYKMMGKEMQHDLTDATLWAVKQGYADKDRLCIYGASYGGYAAIMGAAMEPDLYKCAIGYVGLYNIDLIKKSDIWDRESGRQFARDAWGIDDPEFVRERSPLYHADKIKAAIMLVHGRDDRRVRVENMYQLQEAFDKRGHPYISIDKPHEGHGFFDTNNTIELYNRIEKFLKKHIGN